MPSDFRPRNQRAERSLSATFDGAPNLGRASAETTVTIAPAANASNTGDDRSGQTDTGHFDQDRLSALGPFGIAPLWAWGVGIIVLFVGVGATGIRRLRGRDTAPPADVLSTDDVGDEEESASTVDWVPVDEQSATTGRDPSQLALARESLDAGDPSAAVEISYGAARSALDSEFEMESARTHREFLSTIRADLDTDRRDALHTLTEMYERVAFTPTEVDREQAGTVLSLAASLVPDQNGEYSE